MVREFFSPPPVPFLDPRYDSSLWMASTHALHLSHLSFGASRMHVFVDPRPRYVGNTRLPWGRGKILPLSVPRLLRLIQRDALSSDVNAICIAWISPGRKNEISALLWDGISYGTGLDHSGFSRISFFLEIIFPCVFLGFASFWSLSLWHSSFVTTRNLVFGLRYILRYK